LVAALEANVAAASVAGVMVKVRTVFLSIVAAVGRAATRVAPPARTAPPLPV
jgi:hypothetical protein